MGVRPGVRPHPHGRARGAEGARRARHHQGVPEWINSVRSGELTARCSPLWRRSRVPRGAKASLNRRWVSSAQVVAEELLAPPGAVAEIDCRNLTKEDLEVGFPNDLRFVAEREGVCHGYCFFFEGARGPLLRATPRPAGPLIVCRVLSWQERHRANLVSQRSMHLSPQLSSKGETRGRWTTRRMTARGNPG